MSAGWKAVGLAVGALLLAGPLAAQTAHDCDYCHSLHGSGGGGVPLTAYNKDSDLCLSCHGAGGPAQYDGKTIPKGVAVHAGNRHAAADTTSCVDCHDHAGDVGTNIKLIRTGEPNRYRGGAVVDVVFLGREGDDSFVDATADRTGVCEVCHTSTGHHRIDQSKDLAHYAARDCVGCHAHGEAQGGGGAFQAPAANDQDCVACHDEARRDHREVVSEFGRTAHHADAVRNSDCEICHDQTGHPRGASSSEYVRLNNLDSTSTTPLPDIVLLARPDTAPDEAAKLTVFCMACHEDGVADTYGDPNPFSDGVDIPLVGITSSFFITSASHGSTNSLSCFGDGASGCHGTGHGSEKAKLLGLSPAASPDSGSTPGYYQEEGFCFSCHKTGGVSSKNIYSQFATTITFVAQGAGAQNSVLLNDRHDVQRAAQVVSGAAIECVSCHNPHAVTSAQKLRADPDPGDGIVPAVGARMNTGSLSDYLTEWCLDCHDNTFPAGVSPNTDGLTNIAALWTPVSSGDKHGGAARSNKTSLDGEPISDWVSGANVVLPCWACHDTHPQRQEQLDALVTNEGRTAALNNLFQFRPFVTKRDRVTLIRPDADHPEFGTHTQVTNNASSALEIERGEGLCYTCHFYQMQNNNCYGCHYHGQGSRF